MIRDNGGWDNFKMTEIEKYSCNDNREVERRENELMKELKASMNTNNSFSTDGETKERIKEYYQKNKERIKDYIDKKKEIRKEQSKEYRDKNKEKLKERKKEYYENNKEKILKNSKEYYESNIEKQKIYSDQYREKNKEEINKKKREYYERTKEKNKETLKCDCGCEVSNKNLKRHENTKKHIDLMNKINS
jgi:hypothetical protein